MDLVEGRLPDTRSVSPEQAARGKEVGAVLEAAMEHLSAQDRTILNLRYKEGLSVADVSEATGIPAGTVKVRVFRARAKLRKRMGGILKEVEV